MNFHLTVTKAFAPYKVGDRITDKAKVAEVLAGKNARSVVKTIAPEEPAAPAPAPEPAPAPAEPPVEPVAPAKADKKA